MSTETIAPEEIKEQLTESLIPPAQVQEYLRNGRVFHGGNVYFRDGSIYSQARTGWKLLRKAD